MRELSAKQRQRTDTSARWTEANPLLLRGEIGYESDTGRFKFGDGAARWAALPYRGGVATVNGTTPDAQGNVQLAAGGDHYDLTIRTQEDFDAMTASPDWFGAVSVLLCGTFTIPGTGGVGVTIPESVRILDGAPGSELSALATVTSVLRYEQAPAEEDGRRAANLTVRSGSDSNGFVNMVRMTGCTALNCAAGFTNCNRLVSCRVETGTTGFSFCTNLTDCHVYMKRGTMCSGFARCTCLLNCTATIARGVYSYGFHTCSQLCNCLANVIGSAECVVFNNCSYCTACRRGTIGSNGVTWAGTTTKRCDATCDL